MLSHDTAEAPDNLPGGDSSGTRDEASRVEGLADEGACRQVEALDAPIDLEAALEEFLGDRAFLVEVLDGFLGNVEGQLPVLRQALDGGDGERLSREAHAIKGGAANLTAERLSTLASELEVMGKSGRLAGAEDLLRRIEKAYYDLREYLGRTIFHG